MHPKNLERKLKMLPSKFLSLPLHFRLFIPNPDHELRFHGSWQSVVHVLPEALRLASGLGTGTKQERFRPVSRTGAGATFYYLIGGYKGDC